MEPKPRYVVIGAFIFVMFAMAVLALLWIYGYRDLKEYTTCVILTTESVSGLRVGSSVKYKGIDVGKVTGLQIDPEDPNVVVIFFKVEKRVPLHSDTVAKIVPIGITGLSYIGLSGGKGGPPYMVKIGGKQYPVIRLELSEFQKVSRSLPELLARVDALVTRLNRLVSDKNIENFSRLLVKLNTATEKARRLMGRWEKVAGSSNAMVKRGTALISKAEKLVQELDDFFRENKGSYNRFSQDTLRRLDRLLVEMEHVTERLNVFLDMLEENPSLLIFGPQYSPGPGEGKK